MLDGALDEPSAMPLCVGKAVGVDDATVVDTDCAEEVLVWVLLDVSGMLLREISDPTEEIKPMPVKSAGDGTAVVSCFMTTRLEGAGASTVKSEGSSQFR